MSRVSDLTSVKDPGNRLGRRRFLVALAGAAAVVACGSGSTPPASNESSAATAVSRVSTGMGSLAAAGQSANLTIVKATGQNTFEPSTVTVLAGSTVAWVNEATTPQSATFDPTFAATS